MKTGDEQWSRNSRIINKPPGNPFNRHGRRNVFCPYYSECLDAVVKKSWMHWDCSECEHRFNKDAEPDIVDRVNHSIAYYEFSRKRSLSHG